MKTIKLQVLEKCVEMPVVGLGTWRAQPEEIESAVATALDLGYRHIDTAFNYNTEEAIGCVVNSWVCAGKGRRGDLFIATKLPNFGNRAADVPRFLELSLRKLQTGYVDLYLVHMPFAFALDEARLAPARRPDGGFRLDAGADLVETWRAMEAQVRAGRARAIGLSNFNEEQVARVCAAAEIRPAVLQVEMHAYLQQRGLRALCKELGIAVTAYSPLGSPGANNHMNNKYNYTIKDFPDILGHPLVLELADKYCKTPGQILLRHLVQSDVVVIPKSGNPDRLKSNIDIFNFRISDDDIERLNQLDCGQDGRIFDFLFFTGVENHPEYPFKDRIPA